MSASCQVVYVRIDAPKDPFQLYQSWADDYRKHYKNATIVMNLATCSAEGKVSNRSLMLRELSNERFVFTTNANSQKIRDIEENPNVAACFYFDYEAGKRRTYRQIRIEGHAVKLSKEEAQRLFNIEAHFAKVRYHIVEKQGQPIDWSNLKEKMDECLTNYCKDDTQLKGKPPYYVAYGVVPEYMDFYYSYNTTIADRVIYTKDSEDDTWKIQRMTP